MLLAPCNLGCDDEFAGYAGNERPGRRDGEWLILLLVERAPLRVEAIDDIAVLVEGDGVEDDLLAGLDLDVAGEDFDPRYLLFTRLLSLNLRGSGTAMTRSATTVPALGLSLGADLGQIFIAKTLISRRPTARMPPEMSVLPVVGSLRRDDLDRRARNLRRGQRSLNGHHHDHRQAGEATEPG